MAVARIAIIEDDPSMLRALQRLLRAAGFQPHVYGSAEAFLNESDIGSIDCILCDLSLPGKSGLELFTQLQAQPISPVLVLMTAFDQPDLPEQAARSGAAACLLKPFQGTTLIDVLSSAIEATQRGEA